MSFKRVLDFDDGVAMVITDLHGEGRVFDHLRDTFLRLYKAKQAQRLIICGDLIHGYGDETSDDSLRMVLDVMTLQAELGRDKVVLLMGNHEMPHIYGITLSKGDTTFTPRFERALAQLDKTPSASYRRADVLHFLGGLPLYVRTRAGVMFSHAGAPVEVTSVQHCEAIFEFEHEALLKLYDDKMRASYDVESLKYNAEYVRLAREQLAIDGADDPRLPELLRAELISQTSAEFRLLWDVLFATNEQGWSVEGYDFIVQRFLEFASALGAHQQRVLVAGHIAARGGHAIVGRHQLRLASFAHATPRTTGQYLLLDCATPVYGPADLVSHLRPTLAQ